MTVRVENLSSFLLQRGFAPYVLPKPDLNYLQKGDFTVTQMSSGSMTFARDQIGILWHINGDEDLSHNLRRRAPDDDC